jgi:sugar phosphate isomerase/epimerase
MKISFHTDAFNTSFQSFDFALDFAQQNDIHWIECGVIDGTSWIHGLGYFPHIALHQDPVVLREKMAAKGIAFSQIDAAYPLSGNDGPSIGLPYVLKTIPWAKLAGCQRIATTDGLHKPEGMDDAEAMKQMKRQYQEILKVAEKYEIYINIEVHGHFTTNPDRLDEMLNFSDSPFLRLNLDTGNTLIAGRDPVQFAKKFVNKINHVHIKDVSEELYKIARGEQNGIALSNAAVGEGVNAPNITAILEILRDNHYDGHLSIECDGRGGPALKQSWDWIRNEMKRLNIKEEK